MSISYSQATIPSIEPEPLLKAQQDVIQEAIGILEARMYNSRSFSSPTDVKAYCQLQLAQEPDEYFGCLFLTSQHQLISFERLFRGTIDSASVYPRVLVRKAIELNAAAVILTHNHPSGQPEPSQADIRLTERLVKALALIDIRVLDHIVVGLMGNISFAERGLI